MNAPIDQHGSHHRFSLLLGWFIGTNSFFSSPPLPRVRVPHRRCVAQQEGEKLLRRVPEIDLVMGPQYANRLGDLLEDVMNGNQVSVYAFIFQNFD